MKRSTLGVIGLTAAVATVAAVRFGGWGTVSVESVPDYLVVGKPTELVFGVRQHAVEPLSNLSPTLVARSGRREVTAKAKLIANAKYRAEFSVPEPGDWRITIESGFMEVRANLLPIKALATEPATPIVLTDADRGRVLFAAKACISCHVHGEVDVETQMKNFGPELTGKRFAASYLAEFLANPSIKPASPGKSRMPPPDLRPADIPLLVAFINAERKTAAK